VTESSEGGARREPRTGAEQKASFCGLVFLLRQLAADVLGRGKVEEARGLVDTLEALEVKTRGNLDEEEAELLEGVLTELRLAVVKASRSSAASAEEERSSPGEGGPAGKEGPGAASSAGKGSGEGSSGESGSAETDREEGA
jgi:hypothetical protein